ncbi:MAG: TonB C-terminal domain-containing protein [Verrucomicrobia bacterium]|nr:MAG: TonB C-terminal domain-containing protein [Verrucomicrobiota bacterium]
MNRIEKRCFATSTAAHVGLIATLLFLSFWAARHPPEMPSLPTIELIDTSGVKLVSGLGAGGGTPPPPANPPSRPPQAERPPVPVPPPAKPPQTVPRNPVHSANEPTHPDPAPAKNPPKAREIKVADDVKSQDVDDRLHAPKNAKETARSGKKPKTIVVAQAAKGPTKAELETQRRLEAEAQRRAEAEAAAEAAAEARARAKAAAEAWQNRLHGIRSSLEKNLSSATEITTPGPGGGGQVWLGYGTYLKAFYEARWKRPSSLPVPVAYVGVAITVTRDGTLARFEVIERSGIRALDDSVAEVLQHYRRLDPLPEGTTDAERVFRIKFKLEGINP